MSRYFVRGYEPMICEDTWLVDPLLPSISVSDHVAQDTGLVDARGREIMRAPEPVGFHRPKAKS